jgi:hypothetical protein
MAIRIRIGIKTMPMHNTGSEATFLGRSPIPVLQVVRSSASLETLVHGLDTRSSLQTMKLLEEGTSSLSRSKVLLFLPRVRILGR